MCISLSKCLRRFHLRVFTFCFEVTLKFNWDSCLYIQPIHVSLLKELYEYCHFAETNPNPVCRKCQDAKSTLQREVTSMC